MKTSNNGGSTGDPDDAEGSPERYCWREKIGKERVRHAGTNTPMIPYSPAAGLTPDHIHRLLCAANDNFRSSSVADSASDNLRRLMCAVGAAGNNIFNAR